jgi:hypothetical protein
MGMPVFYCGSGLVRESLFAGKPAPTDGVVLA